MRKRLICATILFMLIASCAGCIGAVHDDMNISAETSAPPQPEEITESQSETPQPTEHTPTPPPVSDNVLPLPDEIVIYQYGNAYALDDEEQILRCVNTMNANITVGETAALSVEEEDIQDMLSTDHCVELVYMDRISEEHALWPEADKLLIPLTGNGTGNDGLLFRSLDGVYMSGPVFAFEEEALTAIKPHCMISEPENIEYGPHAFRSFISEIDNDFANAVIGYQAKLVPEMPDIAYNYDVIFYDAVPLYGIEGYEDGVLVMAEFRGDGESYPELYYWENGEVLFSTIGSYIWGTNYTTVGENTVVFGIAETLLESGNITVDKSEAFRSYTVMLEYGNNEKGVFCNDAHGGAFIHAYEGTQKLKSLCVLDVWENELLCLAELDLPAEGNAANGNVGLIYCPMMTPGEYRATVEE